MAGVAVLLTLDPESGTCTEARVVLGAVAPTPMMAGKTEELLRGRTISPSLIEEAAHAASMECRPVDDYRASAVYRRDMVYVLTRRALEQVFAA